MGDTLLRQTAEAACSALYQNGWALLGEPDGSRGTTWWIRGHNNDQMVRVGVERLWDDDAVVVHVEWRNFMLPPRVLRGVQDLRIVTNGQRRDAERGVEAAMLRTLEIFRDVVQGTGVASGEYAKALVNRKGTT